MAFIRSEFEKARHETAVMTRKDPVANRKLSAQLGQLLKQLRTNLSERLVRES
jgi:hypothetical protein